MWVTGHSVGWKEDGMQEDNNWEPPSGNVQTPRRAITFLKAVDLFIGE
jgi:hypothetical protein